MGAVRVSFSDTVSRNRRQVALTVKLQNELLFTKPGLGVLHQASQQRRHQDELPVVSKVCSRLLS